jgi:hypothetical protein
MGGLLNGREVSTYNVLAVYDGFASPDKQPAGLKGCKTVGGITLFIFS